MAVLAPSPRARGFTLIELLVVLAAMGMLLAVASPRYLQHVERTRESALQQNLHTMRDAIDKFRADQQRYPRNLEDLVERGYLREIPVDPVTERRDTWVGLAPPAAEGAAIADVRSGAVGIGRSGSAYASW